MMRQHGAHILRSAARHFKCGTPRGTAPVGPCVRYGLLAIAATLLLVIPASAQQAGDVDGSGTVDRADIERAARIVVQPAEATDAERAEADVNGDGSVTAQDLVLIARSIAGLNAPPIADAGADLQGTAGTSTPLNGLSSVDPDGEALTFSWRQLHMERNDREYVTESVAGIDNAAASQTSVTAPWPGRYRFELTVTDSDGLADRDTVDAWITADLRTLEAKGAVFGDVFDELGGPDFDVTPSDPDSLAAVQARAMAGPARVGSDYIGFVPAGWYAQINPLPIIEPAGNGVSLTEEVDYAAIVEAAADRGMKVMHQEQVGAGLLPLRPGEADSLNVLKNNSAAWWDGFYDAYEDYLIPRLQRAEAYGVELFSLGLYIDDTFRPDVYPEYDARWRALIDTARTYYSGLLTANVINADRLTFADAFDVVLVTLFPGLYTTSGQIEDLSEPTLEEIRDRTTAMLEGVRIHIGDEVPTYVVFLAQSADAQQANEPPPPDEELDLREQVIYYEGFFQAVSEDPWVKGVFTERWDWFEEGDHPGIFYDVTTGNSPRGKPAEEVIQLWYEAFSP